MGGSGAWPGLGDLSESLVPRSQNMLMEESELATVILDFSVEMVPYIFLLAAKDR